jgi:hypothetical protein
MPPTDLSFEVSIDALPEELDPDGIMLLTLAIYSRYPSLAFMLSSQGTSRQRPNTPQLHPQHIKLHPFLTQRLIPKRKTGATYTPFKRTIKPQPIISVPSTNTEEPRFTQHEVIVDAAVGERFEAYPAGRLGA